MLKKIGVLVSGGGSNLQAIIDQIHHQFGEIVIVLSNKEEVYALERAKKAGIEAMAVTAASYQDPDGEMIKILKDKQVNLVVLAGYMRIIPEAFVNAFENKIINIHPALIPSFCGKGYYGIHVHEAVIDYGAKITGVTVHFVNAQADDGPIIAQKSVAVADDDTPESLQKKVLVYEHKLLPEVIKKYCQDKISVSGRKVCVKE